MVDLKVRVFENMLENEIMSRLEDLKDMYIEEILDSYDINLVVTDPDSKADPQLYRDEFEDRLMSFEYFNREGNNLKFKLPTMDTFDFRGKLGIVKHILEGTVGTYVEVNAEDYEKMFGKRKYTADPLDATVPKKELIYLMRYNSVVRTAERKTFNKNNYLVKYPFSNKPPFTLFEDGLEFVEKMMDKLVDETTKKTVKQFKKTA